MSTAAKKKGGKPPNKPGGPIKRPTIASVSAQVHALDEKIDALSKALRRALAATSTAVKRNGIAKARKSANGAKRSPLPVDAARFDDELLKVLAELDRRGRHDGMIPIPEVREAFLERGWTRQIFDDRLLQAERDFIVDLKTADDPKLLAEPDLAIRESGRGHLQYVVVR